MGEGLQTRFLRCLSDTSQQNGETVGMGGCWAAGGKMLPRETPLQPVPSSLLPHCFWRWPHQLHLARDPPQAAVRESGGKASWFFPGSPHPANIWTRTSALAFCRLAPGRPRTHLPPPAAPAPSVSRSPGAVPSAPAPARRALFPRVESGKPVPPICPERLVRPLGVPKGWGTVPRNAFQMGARSKQSQRCWASPHPAGPKVKAQAVGAKGDWRSSRLSQGRLANLPITQSQFSL